MFSDLPANKRLPIMPHRCINTDGKANGIGHENSANGVEEEEARMRP
jgi:hypothetical protein